MQGTAAQILLTSSCGVLPALMLSKERVLSGQGQHDATQSKQFPPRCDHSHWHFDAHTCAQEWQLAPLFNRFNAFELLPGNRATCNDYLSTTVCSGGPAINLYYEDDLSGRQQWLLSPVGNAPSPPPAAPPLPNGHYTIQSVGTAAEGNPSCATFMGYGACGGSTAIPSVFNTNLATATWDVVQASSGSYTVRALTLESCTTASPTYLGAQPCASGSNQVALATADDGTGIEVGQPHHAGTPAAEPDPTHAHLKHCTGSSTTQYLQENILLGTPCMRDADVHVRFSSRVED